MPRNNSSKNKKKIIAFMYVIIVFTYLALLLYGVSLFWIGFHNIDLGYNMRYLDMIDGDPDQDYQDVGNNGKIRSGEDLYQLGTNQMFKSFFISMLGCSGVVYLCLNK